MPIKRDSDGNIIEQPTKQADTAADGARPTDPVPPKQGKVNNPASGHSSYDAPTELAGTLRGENKQQGKPADPKTRIYRPGRTPLGKATQPASSTTAATTNAPQPTAMEDPPVGWLVVIRGPGQGNFVALGHGANSMGRDASERLPLNFGDEMISRKGHAIITYDPRGKKFYISHGGGTNLTYINDQPVLAPQELQPNTNIVISNTTLRFVPLCGAQFDWDQEAS